MHQEKNYCIALSWSRPPDIPHFAAVFSMLCFTCSEPMFHYAPACWIWCCAHLCGLVLFSLRHPRSWSCWILNKQTGLLNLVVVRLTKQIYLVIWLWEIRAYNKEILFCACETFTSNRLLPAHPFYALTYTPLAHFSHTLSTLCTYTLAHHFSSMRGGSLKNKKNPKKIFFFWTPPFSQKRCASVRARRRRVCEWVCGHCAVCGLVFDPSERFPLLLVCMLVHYYDIFYSIGNRIFLFVYMIPTSLTA